MAFPIDALEYQKPRYLTATEVAEIVAVVPRVSAATSVAAKCARTQIQEKLTLQIQELLICPDSIHKLKAWIINQFNRSIIHPGQPIGITTGESVGSPMTQMTLNTFHEAGSSKSMGIDAFREVFNGSEHRKNENTTVHYNDKNLSYEEVLETRRALVGVTITDIMLTTEIRSSYREDHTLIPTTECGWWYSAYNALMDKDFVQEDYYLRMTFSPNLLYAYKITLNDIVKVLESRSHVPSYGSKDLRCVASPTSIGIIDVYPNSQIVSSSLNKIVGKSRVGITQENASLIFIQRCIIPYLSMRTVRGIQGITGLYPVSETSWSIIRAEEKYMNKDALEAYIKSLQDEGRPEEEIAIHRKNVDLAWTLWLDLVRMKTTGIGIQKMRTLLELAGISINYIPTDIDKGLKPSKGEVRNQITIVMPEGWEQRVMESQRQGGAAAIAKRGKQPKLDQLRPGDYINMLLKAEEAETLAWSDSERQKGVVFPSRDPSPIYRAGTYVYSVTNGINLKHLLAHPLVDPRRTISNNPHEIMRTFDAEAARNFIARDFYDMISGNGSYVNSRHISLVADFMTNMGVITPITSRGISRQNRGVFADASFEHPVEFFNKAAISGRWEDVTSTSTCIFIGKRALVGTGAFDLKLRNDVLEALENNEAKMKERLTSIETLKADVDDIGDITFDTGDMDFRDPKDACGDLLGDMMGGLDAASNLLGVEYKPIVIRPPTIVRPPTLLVVKGPIPKVVGSSLPAAQWIHDIVNRVRKGLPSLRGFTVQRLLAVGLSTINNSERLVVGTSAEDFLKE